MGEGTFHVLSVLALIALLALFAVLVRCALPG